MSHGYPRQNTVLSAPQVLAVSKCWHRSHQQPSPSTAGVLTAAGGLSDNTNAFTVVGCQ